MSELPSDARRLSHDAASLLLLTTFVAGRDVPCPRCAYNLRDLIGDRCPECGDALTLQVGLVEPKVGAYVAAVGGAFLGTGASGLLAAIATMQAPQSWWSGVGARVMVILLVVSAAASIVLVVGRRTFRRCSDRSQRRMAAAVWAFVVTCGTLVAAFFR